MPIKQLTMKDRHGLLLDTNRNSYVESAKAPLYLALSNLKRSKSMSLRFRRLTSRKGAELGRMLLLNTNKKSYMTSEPSNLT